MAKRTRVDFKFKEKKPWAKWILTGAGLIQILCILPLLFLLASIDWLSFFIILFLSLVFCFVCSIIGFGLEKLGV